MSWRGMEGGVAAARAGHDVVIVPDQPLLPRLFPGRGPRVEPPPIGGFAPLRDGL